MKGVLSVLARAAQHFACLRMAGRDILKAIPNATERRSQQSKLVAERAERPAWRCGNGASCVGGRGLLLVVVGSGGCRGGQRREGVGFRYSLHAGGWAVWVGGMGGMGALACPSRADSAGKRGSAELLETPTGAQQGPMAAATGTGGGFSLSQRRDGSWGARVVLRGANRCQRSHRKRAQ
ncbi:uncharacterized protein BDZ99DRAFT_519312 [Mytilinidion resinicola]|uniref:Uncharacterized protein n=1 Tax=Mytilinidion resinicola TaxID=574789 RepID=A0A6A6YRT4_9PEZI|nr:uncharacterized protein BDZ99DRAFT_519312 [Mytilinidion resinicola]KAF2810617.1 hypothetical protein BDZ99DRAFT_519312 [Mytilinidion resinicola]